MLGHGDLFSFIHHLLPRIASVSLWIMIAPIVIASAIPVCDREKPNIDPHAISRIKAKVPKSTAAASGTQFLLSICIGIGLESSAVGSERWTWTQCL